MSIFKWLQQALQSVGEGVVLIIILDIIFNELFPTFLSGQPEVYFQDFLTIKL
ncbi:hypothetical protein NDI39_26045 [Microcoleus sp. ZQ-A2]|nr:hypothetical protein [Microcoleus sp. FACHB-1]